MNDAVVPQSLATKTFLWLLDINRTAARPAQMAKGDHHFSWEGKEHPMV
jgi:hypothetical protein